MHFTFFRCKQQLQRGTCSIKNQLELESFYLPFGGKLNPKNRWITLTQLIPWEEFEDEYSETNRGEIYRVISTVVEIIRLYHHHHAYSTSYEFSGEFKEGNVNRETSIRSLLYYRKAKEIMHPAWDIEISGNKVIVRRKKQRKTY